MCMEFKAIGAQELRYSSVDHKLTLELILVFVYKSCLKQAINKREKKQGKQMAEHVRAKAGEGTSIKIA